MNSNKIKVVSLVRALLLVVTEANPKAQLTAGLTAQALHGVHIFVTQPSLVVLICDWNQFCGGVFEEKILCIVGRRIKHLKSLL